ncbi:MAG: alpha/beta fold hydrolase [Myxococcales bacterium]|jgi:dipeptidyl aminopeptidase/acylaminoacyl peptidase|nr:alpha/beta fold hydrolase [Myxococcales bacterium]
MSSVPVWAWLGVVVPLVALVVIVGETAAMEQRSLRPPRTSPGSVPEALQELAVQEVSIDAPDGVSLSAWYVPPRNGAAVALFHGYAGDRLQLTFEAVELARRGYGVLLGDARAHGRSGGEVTTHGDRERDDARAVLDFLADAAGSSTRLGVFGFSAGATPLPAVAAEDPRVRAVVLAGCTTSAADFSRDESGRLSWLKSPVILAVMRANGIDPDAIDPLAAIPRLSPRALLIVHGENDSVVPVGRARSLFAAAGEPKRLHVFPQAGHGGYGDVEPAGYARLLLDFFDQHLLGRDGRPSPAARRSGSEEPAVRGSDHRGAERAQTD